MPPAKKTSNIPIGTMLDGKYRITREIGRGGMASIYEAVNVDIGKRIAVKVLNPELTSSTVVVERFLREARAAAAVKSPYICDVYDAGRLDDGRPFLILELLEGESLYERMVKVRRFEPDFVARVFTQVSRGLTKAHEGNIIHRDLKPENIFITKDDDGEVVAKIVDFGLAKFYAPIDGTAAQQRLTREGAVFGTPAYMSPEQVKGQGQVDHRADLWAIGCMVFECLIGRTVWSTEQGVAMIFAQIATAEIPVPSRLRSALPPGFDRWFAKALAREPDHRFQSAKELADELAAALGQGSPSMFVPTSVRELEQQLLAHPPVSERMPVSAPTAFAPTERPPPSNDPYLDDEAPTHQMPALSVSDTTSSHTPGGTAELPRPAPTRSLRPWIALLGALAVGASGYVVWDLFIRPRPAPVTSPPPVPSSTAASSGSQRAPEVLVPPRATQDLPEWALKLASGQELLSKGDLEGAKEAFREATEGTGSGAPRVMLENLKIAAKAEGPCEMHALGRPRPLDLTDSIRRPAIVHTVHGPLLTWVDDHEVPGQWHAYTTLLDDHMRPLGAPVDVSPEAASVQTPRLFATDNQVILLFSDPYGNKPGVYVRRLTTTGRILGAPVRVSEERSATTWPSMTSTPLGDYWLAYADDAEKSNSSKLYLRKLTPDVKIGGEQTLIGEYAYRQGLHRSRARAPSVTFAGNSLLVAYLVERGRDQTIVRQRIALDDPQLAKGLTAEDPPKSDRVIGEDKEITDRKGRVFYPAIACDGASCYAVWRDEPKGVNAAYIDPNAGTTIWRKRFAHRGTQVSMALDGTGSGLVAWYQDGRVRVAPLTRDGVRDSSSIARVTGEQPRPSIAKGANHGEWLVAWTDYEAGHLEAYVARVICK